MIKKIYLKRFHYDQFYAIFDQIKNKESCGLMLGKNTNEEAKAENICWVENTEPVHALGRYRMDPQQQINIMMATKNLNPRSTRDLVAIVHTHPKWAAQPSAEDFMLAKKAGFNVVYIIIGLDREVNAFYWTGEKFEPVEIIYDNTRTM